MNTTVCRALQHELPLKTSVTLADCPPHCQAGHHHQVQLAQSTVYSLPIIPQNKTGCASLSLLQPC
jgi:hypothetical protein